MIVNYLKIAWRNLTRNRNYAVINILGLAIGLACFMLIILYVRDEMAYDKFHGDGDRIYRMALERKYPGRARNYAIIPHSYAQTVADDLSEVEDACRLFYFQGNNMVYEVNDELFEESYQMFADSNFFDFFTIPLLQGDPESALTHPNSVILTESTANKLFGQENPIGKILDLEPPANNLVVSGVCADVPEQSHLRFNMLRSVATLNQFLGQPNYISFSAYTYLKLHPTADPIIVESKFPDLVVKYASGQVLNSFGVDYEEYQAQGNGYRYFLQPLPDIYLNSNLEAEIKAPGSRQRVYFFLCIAILILLIACINFMNLATAKSAGRAREVGIRKTLGSERAQIATQFLVEAILITLAAAVIAWSINMAVLKPFNELAGKSFTSQDLWQPGFLLILLGVGLLTGLLSGAYPSIALSSFKPVEVLHGKLMQNTRGAGLRNVLVVFQFAVSVFLIIASILVYQQWTFTQNKDLGFDKEGLLTVQGAGRLDQSTSETFKNQILQLPAVNAVSGCNTQPGGQYFGMSFKPSGALEMTTGSGLIVDEGYIECMDMEMAAGRSFSKDFMDTLSIVINEAAVREMNLDDPVGKTLVTNENFLNADDTYTIVGVVKDFHFQSLHHPITPLFFVHNQHSFVAGVDQLVTVRFDTRNYRETLTQIEDIWAQFEPEVPFRYAFLDQEWATLYDKEITTRRISGLFTLIAIFIACLGLLALAAFTAEQRTKEIGIRKVLGASVPNLVTLLSRDFLKLVLIGIIIAVPLAWYGMSQWLQQYAYRIEMNVGVFLFAAFLAILIAFITVSFQSIRAALTNPIKSLRDE